MNQLKLTIIGIPDIAPKEFTAGIKEAVDSADYFAGGIRHRTLIELLLPAGYRWTDIEVPLKPFLDDVAEKGGRWCIFASGDPLFFGIANTLKREFPDAEFTLFPSFNSLQMLAHKLMIPYGEYETVTLTGRSWNLFDSALIRQAKGMLLLTDRHKTPSAIAQRMLDYGYSGYKIHVGEKLGGVDERVRTLSLEAAAKETFEMPNAVIIERTTGRLVMKAIPDYLFTGLEGRPKMITKMPVRMISLMMMELHRRSVMWDVGACTGSISVEAKLHAPHLSVHAFEIRTESREIISSNCKKFGTPGIEITIADFLETDVESHTPPDAVFLGGYGGRMEEVLDKIDRHLQPGGCIVFNAVSFESKSRFFNWTEANHYMMSSTHQITVDDNNPITIITINKPKGINIISPFKNPMA